MEKQYITHPIPPTFNEHSEVLILGSFPSVKSREAKYFYGHPQNRFWRVISSIFEEDVPTDTAAKKDLLLRRHIAAWDVIASCRISGSSDASISDVVPNDLTPILSAAPVKAIFTNGRKSEELYKKYIEPTIGIAPHYLPSTSPANAAWSVERLTEVWRAELGKVL